MLLFFYPVVKLLRRALPNMLIMIFFFFFNSIVITGNKRFEFWTSIGNIKKYQLSYKTLSRLVIILLF